MVKRLSAERTSRFERFGSTVPVVHGKPIVKNPPTFKDGAPSPRQRGAPQLHSANPAACPSSTAPPPPSSSRYKAPKLRSRSLSSGRIKDRSGDTSDDPKQQTNDSSGGDGGREDAAETARAPQNDRRQDVSEAAQNAPADFSRGGDNKGHENDRMRSLSVEGKRKRIEIYRGVKDARKKAIEATKHHAPGEKTIPPPIAVLAPSASSALLRKGETPRVSNLSSAAPAYCETQRTASSTRPPPTIDSNHSNKLNNTRQRKIKSLSPRSKLPEAPSLWCRSPGARESLAGFDFPIKPQPSLSIPQQPTNTTNPSPKTNKKLMRPISPPHLRGGGPDKKTRIADDRQRRMKAAMNDKDAGRRIEIPPRIPHSEQNGNFTPRTRKRQSTTLQRRAKSLERFQHEPHPGEVNGQPNDKPRAVSAGRASQAGGIPRSGDVRASGSYTEERLSEKLQRARRRQHHPNPPATRLDDLLDLGQSTTSTSMSASIQPDSVLGASVSPTRATIMVPYPGREKPPAEAKAARIAKQHRAVTGAVTTASTTSSRSQNKGAQHQPEAGHPKSEPHEREVCVEPQSPIIHSEGTTQNEGQPTDQEVPSLASQTPKVKGIAEPAERPSPSEGLLHDAGGSVKLSKSPSNTCEGEYPQTSSTDKVEGEEVDVFYKKPIVPPPTRPINDRQISRSSSSSKAGVVPREQQQPKPAEEKPRKRPLYDKAYIKSLLSESPSSGKETQSSETKRSQNTPAKFENTGSDTSSGARRAPSYEHGAKKKETATEPDTNEKTDEQLETESSVFNFSKNDPEETDKDKFDLGSSIFSFLSAESNKKEPEEGKEQKQERMLAEERKTKQNSIPDKQEEHDEVELQFESAGADAGTISENKKDKNDNKHKFSMRSLFPGKAAKSRRMSTGQELGHTHQHRKVWAPVFNTIHIRNQRTPRPSSGDDASPSGGMFGLKNMISQRTPNQSSQEDSSPQRKSWTPALKNKIGQRTHFFGRGRKKHEEDMAFIEQVLRCEKTVSRAASAPGDQDVDDVDPVLHPTAQMDPVTPSSFQNGPVVSRTLSKEVTSKITKESLIPPNTAGSTSHNKCFSPSAETLSTGYRLEAMSTQESQGTNTMFGPTKLCICGPSSTSVSKVDDAIPLCAPLTNCVKTTQPNVDDYSATSSKESVCVLSDIDRKNSDLRVSFSETIETIESREANSQCAHTSKRKKSSSTDIERPAEEQRTRHPMPPATRPPRPPQKPGLQSTMTQDKPKKSIGLPPLAFRKQRAASFNSKEGSTNGTSRNVVTSSSFTHTGAEQVETLLRVPESKEIVACSSGINGAIGCSATHSIDAEHPSQVNGTVFNVRISLAYLSGLVTTAFKRPSRRQSSSLVTAYAHVDFSSAIATQASKTALSTPITPIYSEGQVRLKPVVWSGRNVQSKTQGRLYFSVVLEKQSGQDSSGVFSPETICLVVGVKSGNETIPLGLVSFTIDGTEVSGRRVNFAVQPDFVDVEAEQPEKGAFKLRRKTPKHAFRGGDHLYALDSSAVLSARVDITNEAPGAPGPSVWNDREGDEDSFIHSVLSSSTFQTDVSSHENHSRCAPARRQHPTNKNPISRLSGPKEMSSEQVPTPVIKNSHSTQSAFTATDSIFQGSVVVEEPAAAKKWRWAHRGKETSDQAQRRAANRAQVKKLSVRKAFLPTLMRVKRLRNSFGGHSSSQDSMGAHARQGAFYDPRMTAAGDDQARSLKVNTNFSFSRNSAGGYLNNSSSDSYTYDDDPSKRRQGNGAASWIYDRAKDVGLFSQSSDEADKITTFSFSTNNDTHMQTSDLSESIGTSASTAEGSSVPGVSSQPTRSQDSRSYDSRTYTECSRTIGSRSRDTDTYASRTEASKDTLDEFRKILWIAKKLDMKPDSLIDRLKNGEDIESLLRAKRY